VSELFQRAVRVIIGTKLVTGLRVQFKVKKTSKPEPNDGEVTIYNLSAESRAALASKGTRIIVEAGYGDTIAQIFAGDSRAVDHVHEGPDWLTKVQLGDGERAYRWEMVSESFKPGNTFADVFARVARSTSLDVEDAIRAVSANVHEQFTQGYTAHGRALLEVGKLLKGRGLEHSIQDGKLQVLKEGSALSDTGPLLSAATGLIGSPAHGTAANSKPSATGAVRGPQMLKVKSLLQPGLRPGGRFHLESLSVKGDFRVVNVNHVGDTFGGDWFSEVEALPL
jgi:hypothetical protein